jgi:MYXO-CTERM domain-containing protein
LRAADQTLYVGSDAGLFAAPPADGGPAFQIVHQACPDGGLGGCDLQVRAIAERGGLLYVAADDFPPNDMALGTSSDQGVHFTRLLQFVDIGGLGCAGTNIEETCGPTWVALQQLFGIDAGVEPPKPAGCGCGAGGSDGSLLALVALAGLHRRRTKSTTPHPTELG